MKVRAVCSFVLLAWALSVPLPLVAQQGCPPAPFAGSAKEREQNIFSEQQESDLGDAIAEHLQRNFKVIDDEVTATLRRVGENLLRQLPPNNIRFQFLLVDLPVVNAFASPGGRIYATRKLVVASRSEDELAGVLAHEIGHIITRQTAVDFSRMLKKVLGVTQVGDRKDIFDKYHQFLENIAMKSGALGDSRGEAQREQIEADQVAVYLAAVAGYAPQSYAQFWDRIAETKGKTGSGLSDFFGFTKPEQKRLREMLKMANALPASCAGLRAALPAEEYARWQSAVVAYNGLGRRESLHAVVTKKKLDPPLQDDINHLKFSADGQFVLAQDDTSIYVLSREPFATLFRIDARDAYPAQFAPDGKTLVFHRPDLRVERWDIEEEKRTDIQELVIPKGCLQTALSPDGKFLLCVNASFDVLLFNVASGQQVFQKKEFWTPMTISDIVMLLLARFAESGTVSFVRTAFSPDAHYFVAAQGDMTLAVDLTTMTTLSLPGQVKRHLRRTFAFMGPDRLIGVNADKSQGPAMLMKFPSGEKLNEVDVGAATVAAPARGNAVLLRPIEKFPVGVMDLETKKIFLANRNAALDVFDKFWVSERRSGSLGLYTPDSERPLAEITLPRSTLGTLRAAALSADMKYLAISQRGRGGVWNLEKGERVFFVRGFRGAYFADDGMVYADFPKYQERERGIARLHLASRQVLDGPKIEAQDATQYGAFLVHMKPRKKDANTDRDVTLEVQDARTGTVLWSRPFPKERPEPAVSPATATMVLGWGLDTGHAKEAIKNDATLKARLAAMKEKEGDYFLEVVDARTGKSLGKLLVETGKGSFQISRAYAVGDYVVIVDTSNRVLVYSLSSGEQKGKVFGTWVAVSAAGNLLCVENETGQLTIYDIARMEKRDQFVFTHPIAMIRFSADGKRLFVLTSEQTTYVLDMSAVAAAASR